MNINKDMEALQNILSQELTEEIWEELINLLENWEDSDSFSMALDYAAQKLENWSNEDRKAPQENWEAIREGAPIPRWWQLVRHLELGEYDDSKLSPIEAFINLTSLEFSGVNLGSLELLTELTKLTSLKLVDDLIPFDIKPLGKLTQLKYLRLALPELTDLDGLDELINLEELDLSYNFDLTNIEALATLVKLDYLKLGDCRKIVDLSPLSQLTTLRILDLTNCSSITDISALAGLNQLEYLYLKGCESLTDVSPLANLHTLRELDISDCDGITDISPLISLTNCQIRQ
jgi:Leucine-rich repeat (LRR) protein